jgi:glycosyltransferase involved in cell wall biosynthesis
MGSSVVIPYRLGLQQRVFPAYRAPFFDALARACTRGLSVFSGEPMDDEALGQEGVLNDAQHILARNYYFGAGPFLTVWQHGFLNWLDHWNPDILIVEANPRNASTNPALQWMRSRHRPVIGWGLGAPPVRGPLPEVFEKSRRRFLARFDALIAYSNTGVKQFMAAGFPKERIFLAPNAVTPRPALPPASRPDTFAGGKPAVLFVGRLQPRKRVDALIRACAELPHDLHPRLVIVGDGPSRPELEALAQAVYPEAQFVGEKHASALAPYYAAADLFVLPGTGGLAVQQAMAAGLPVLVAEADGTQADLVRPQNGWLMPPGDDAALTALLAEALSDPERLRRMGQESFRIVSEEVNLDIMVDVFAQAARCVMGDRSG